MCVSLSLFLPRLIWGSGVTAALMKVQWRSEPDLAAQHRALQLGVQRKGTEFLQTLLALLSGAGNILQTQSVELKPEYLTLVITLTVETLL